MILPTLSYEKKLWQEGVKNIVGIDEVGRGSWAGPLVAAGVILPRNFKIPKGFAESKQLSQKKREEFAEYIIKKSITTKIVEISHIKINSKGLAYTTQSAFRKIIMEIDPEPDYCLVDAFCIKYFPKRKQSAIVKGDEASVSIAAASIIAKVYRDKLMSDYSIVFPNFKFEDHKGYGTKLHQRMIKTYGFCDIHRTSFKLRYLVS